MGEVQVLFYVSKDGSITSLSCYVSDDKHSYFIPQSFGEFAGGYVNRNELKDWCFGETLCDSLMTRFELMENEHQEQLRSQQHSINKKLDKISQLLEDLRV